MPIFPRKWSIRYSWDSSMYWWISRPAPGPSEVVAERLLDHDAAGLGQTRVGQSLDHRPNRNGGISR